MSGALVTLDGVAGTYISTDDVNLLDADSAHCHQANPWINYDKFSGAGTVESGAYVPRFGVGNYGKNVASTPGTAGGCVAAYADIAPATEYSFTVEMALENGGGNDMDWYIGGIVTDGAGGTGTVVQYLTIPASTVTVVDGDDEMVTLSGTFTSHASAASIAIGVLTDGDITDSVTTVYHASACLRLGSDATFLPSFRIVGDLDIETKLLASTPSAGANEVVNRGWNDPNKSFRLTVNDATPTDDVNFYYFAAATPTDQRSYLWTDAATGTASVYRVTRVASTGQGELFVDGVSAGTKTGTSGALNAGVGDLAISILDGVAGRSMGGDMYYLTVRDGIGGPIVAAFRAGQLPFASGPIPDLTEWTDPSGRVWVFHGGITFTEASSAPPDFKVKRYAEGVGSGRDITIMDGSMSIKRYESV